MLDGLRECYRILDVEPGASLEEVKRSYRELVKVWHPDRFANDPALQAKAQEKLKQINLAYERICKGETAESGGRTAAGATYSAGGEQQRGPSSSQESQRQTPGNPPPPRPEPSQPEANLNRPAPQPGTEAQWSHAGFGFGFLALSLWLAPTFSEDFSKYEAGEGIRTTRNTFLLYQLFGKQGLVVFFLLFGGFMGYVGLCHARALLSGQNLIRFGLKKGHLIAATVILGFFVLTGDRPGRRSEQRQTDYTQASPGPAAQPLAIDGPPPNYASAGSALPILAPGAATSARAAVGEVVPSTVFTVQNDKVSYIIGFNIGRSMMQDGLVINPDALAAALKDVFADAKPQLTEVEVQTVMQGVEQTISAARTGSLSKNKAEGEKFLADNKKKAGVKTTASGLQYLVIKDGTGKTPKVTDTVKIHYRGTLISGTEFDSSYRRGEPAEFLVNAIIKGWTEALQLMKEGAKWQLFVPSELAYSERGAGPDIGPNSTLIFDIELISISAR